MSDETVVVANPAPGSADLTAGMLLRRAREATGLHVAALAVSMKVPVKKLEALEADRHDELPDAVFIRALAASVCRTLKVDATAILAKLPQSSVPKLDKTDRGVSMPARGPSFFTGNSLTAFASRPTVWVVALLLLAALAVLLFPEARTVGLAQMAKPATAEAVLASSATEVKLGVAPAVADTAAPATSATAVVAPAPLPAQVAASAPGLVAAPAAAKAASAPAPMVASVSTLAAASEASPAATGVLVFKANARAWVRVSDSHGVVQFEKTLAAGETAVAPGVPPLSVVVGNVAATEVLLRGQPYKLEDANQNNVARFEVK